MSEFFHFAGEHPWLTFFLFLIVFNAPVQIIKALKNQDDD